MNRTQILQTVCSICEICVLLYRCKRLESSSVGRSHRTTMSTSSAHSTDIVHAGSSFEDAEAVDEVYHEITAQCIVFRILCITCRYAAGDIAALLQDVINLKPESCLVPFQEGFGGRSIPKDLFLLEPIRIARVGRPVDIAFNLEIEWEIDSSRSTYTIIESVEV